MNVGETFRCPSCRIRFQVGAPTRPNAPYHFDIETLDSGAKYRVLREYAAEFDQLAGDELFTAQTFLDWLEPSILGSERHRATVSLTSLLPGALR